MSPTRWPVGGMSHIETLKIMISPSLQVGCLIRSSTGWFRFDWQAIQTAPPASIITSPLTIKCIYTNTPHSVQAVCQLKNRTTIDSNEHREKHHMNKYINTRGNNVVMVVLVVLELGLLLLVVCSRSQKLRCNRIINEINKKVPGGCKVCLVISIRTWKRHTRPCSSSPGSDGLLNVDINLMHVFIKREPALQEPKTPASF